MTSKKQRGQFYTTNVSYILDGFSSPVSSATQIVEPFAGQGDLLEWIDTVNPKKLPIFAYDIEPKKEGIITRDTLRNPPDYTNAWVVTNPPYLARNKTSEKELFDMYDTNDLYKCFITSLTQKMCRGGILIVPAGFFFSSRENDTKCRGSFMSKYKITWVKYFEETVFADTTTTVVAFAFERSETLLQEQTVKWTIFPRRETKEFHVGASTQWIVGGEIYHLPISTNIKIRRHVEGVPLKEGEQQTHMTLNALDSGTQSGRISLRYDNTYIYPAKESSRTYATLRIVGKYLSEQEQITLCRRFNEFIETKRKETWSLFLPQFRESKEYARKRIPFELVYSIVLHLIAS